MFIYQGKFNWGKWAQDETAVIILPSGPIRVGDIVWFLSQWTNGYPEKRVDKLNLALRIPIHRAPITKKGDDTINPSPVYFNWEITSSNGYEKLHVVISRDGDKSEMEFNRIWMPEGEWLRECGRLWLGKINWTTLATNEFCLFVVPEGFGEGRPVHAMWQWTKDSEGKEKVPSFHSAQQKIASLDDKGAWLSFDAGYEVTCNWTKATDILTVHMKGQEADADLGEYKLLAVTNPHTHEWDAPLPPPQNAELQVRLPQPEPSLPRVLDPLPFPIGIIENLRHAVAYADQAGYLVNYAHERFNQLDINFHLRGEVIEERNAAIAEFRIEVKKLEDNLTVEKAKVTDLTKRLDEARATYEAKLKEKDEEIKKDEDQIKKDRGHDIDDHKTIDRLAAQLEYERASKAEVQKNLDQTKTALAAAEASLATASATIANLTTRVASLEAELEVEKKDIDRLRKDAKQKTDRISQLERNNADLQSKLNGALQDVKNKQVQINAKDSTIRDQSYRIDNLVKESNAKSITISNLQSQINNLQQQIRNLQSTPVFKFRCNIKCQQPSHREIAVDLTNGGGASTPVQCYSLVNNCNQTWDMYSIGDRNNVVVIKNTRNNYILWSAGRNQKARCDPGRDTSDQAAQWELEGTTLDSINNNTVFKIRNVKYGMYLDLQQGDTSNYTPFLTWDGNNGLNQKFKISKH
ncbi:hypothetical protein J7337_003342 [Fusarium musae]|uniref:Ricin B lectin domain-containing protein n=1 Tax=Fusarium musae TaxID=1042133 RepID=A0A9P8IUJ8_9HYPO|nr:hypothetical protein J7337_003342 [Fusarium musae]KAG9506359.1 hypothetical protein J7337_003342 [Fusarium musae]